MPALSSPAAADPIDDYLTQQMERNRIPGLSVAVVRNGKVKKLKAYGMANLEWNARATNDTAYPLASATKPLTGTALLLLIQEGRISLDDSVRKHLPGVPESWSGITIRHLATHSAGIPDDLGPTPVRTAEEGVRAAYALPLEYAPGTRSSYGSSGYIVLQHILEKVTGKPLPELLRERLFQPLGMKNTRFSNETDRGPARVADIVPNRASVYNWEGGEQRVFSFLFAPHSYSAGGLYSSAADLARWITALDGGNLLTAQSLERMWTPPIFGEGSGAAPGSFAIGWTVQQYRGRRTVGHSGGPALSDILRFPEEKLTIIVLANQQMMYPYLAQGVADLLIPASSLPDKGMEDRDEATTTLLKAVLADAAHGTADPARFTPEAQQQIVPVLTGFALPFFRSLEPLGRFTLLEEREKGDVRTRRYRAWYGKKPILWRFDLTREGKIISMQPTPE